MPQHDDKHSIFNLFYYLLAINTFYYLYLKCLLTNDRCAIRSNEKKNKAVKANSAQARVGGGLVESHVIVVVLLGLGTGSGSVFGLAISGLVLLESFAKRLQVCKR